MSHHRYSHVLHEIYETPWMISPESLELIASIVERKIQGVELTEEELLAIRGANPQRQELQMPDKPSVAVLPIQGPIFPKANMMTDMSGATSIGQLQKDFGALMDSEMVTGIVLNIDSPGGQASMIKEMADTIHAARGKKPIIAVANPNAMSAAYYLGSQADEFYSTPSGMVGSVGVVAMHLDTSAQDEKDGIKRTILTAGKYKAEANPHQPLSEDAKAFKLEQMQETYDEFVSDVARGRGIDAETVAAEFGQGRAYRAKTALKRGMIDGVETLDAVVTNASTSQPTGFAVSMHTASNTGQSLKVQEVKLNERNKDMDITPETLEFLGLSEDATSEDLENAIRALRETPDDGGDDGDEGTESEFAKLFPEQAAEISRLREVDRRNAAKMFADTYAQFSTGKGFSSLGLEMVEDLHLKVADGLVTHSDLKSFLDFVASDTAIVDYKEYGSKQGVDVTAVDDGQSAATKLRDIAYEKVASEGLSYGDALARAMQENPALASVYRNSVASPVERGEG